jgi:hypothetical protein
VLRSFSHRRGEEHHKLWEAYNHYWVNINGVKPSGDSLDQIKLAADAVDKLKNVKAAGTDIDESLTSLIEHFQNVANPEIKRSLLGEISKKISLVKLRKIVKNKITLYE